MTSVSPCESTEMPGRVLLWSLTQHPPPPSTRCPLGTTSCLHRLPRDQLLTAGFRVPHQERGNGGGKGSHTTRRLLPGPRSKHEEGAVTHQLGMGWGIRRARDPAQSSLWAPTNPRYPFLSFSGRWVLTCLPGGWC